MIKLFIQLALLQATTSLSVVLQQGPFCIDFVTSHPVWDHVIIQYTITGVNDTKVKF
jgi:hypothetical protein